MIGFIFPPHPASNMKIRPEAESLNILEKEGGWTAQRKYNGSHTVVAINGDVVSLWNRQGEPFGRYRISPDLYGCFLNLNTGGKEVVLDGELIHEKAKSKITNTQASTHTIVLFDLLYYGKYLLMETFEERYKLLTQICKSPTKLEDEKRGLLVEEKKEGKLWLAECFDNDFSYRFYEMYEFDKNNNDKYPEIEGLMCKRLGRMSRLRMGNVPYDVTWMMRVRKTKEKTYLF